MSKPRIFINMHYMELGGAEMALIGLLNAFDPEKVDVDLFLNKHSGPYMKYIPDYINILPEIPQYAAIETPFNVLIKKGLIKESIHKIICNSKCRKYIRKHPDFGSMASQIYMDYYISKLPDIKEAAEQYDLAISFLDPPHIVQEKVNARTKIEWIHTDFATIPYDKQLAFKRWAANDYIISISDDITASFTSIYPELSDKIIKIENILSPSFIRDKAKEYDPAEFNSKHINLCSIGRLNAEAKNFKNIPHIARRLVDIGLDFKWFLIGPGDQQSILDEIKTTGTENNVFILGLRENPYPYISNCDIYIQPSIYEGKSICVREAQILYKPTIITRYPTSASQINDGIDGIICDLDNDSVAKAIYELASSKDLQTKLINHLKTHDFGFQDEVNKVYRLIH